MDGEQLFAEDFRVDILYRRLLTQDILDDPESNQIVIDAMRQNLCFVANGFRGYLLSHKGLFALLSDPAVPLELSDLEREACDRTIPWTRIFSPDDPVTCPWSGDQLPMKALAMARQSDLVIKPCLGYGGQEVTLGWRVSEDDWLQAMASAASRPHVLQQRLHIPVTQHPAWIEGELQFLDFRFDIDPYILGGRRAHGLGIRLSPHELLNVAAGAGSAIPAYVIS